ncbi:uncharacterized protein B0P05DRAFT_241445 [Gilbertella persicaria]|uniref:uncharacterized protein n=1 Tax=Gilbertella persicaria TaxID=101096 RepID=UPI00221F10AB|nr:uncharacterized protein B0P05DRAFT_241445 [Gilbertella persicaria]KAI8062773.1 hypothetical protein B0P05DRAFT_241445 [Gilbertella persicaria]
MTDIEDKLELILSGIFQLSQDLQRVTQDTSILKDEIKDIKTRLAGNHQKEKPDTIKQELQAASTGPFPAYKPIDRIMPRPSPKETTLFSDKIKGEKKIHSLQFTSSLYIDLIQKALGAESETGLDYKAMVKEAVLVTKAVISHLKELYHINSTLKWSRVDPTVKLEAYRQLEEATQHLLPLKLCSEFWGAHVLLSNFWLKRKKLEKVKEESTDSRTPEESSQNNDRNPFSISFLTNQQQT